MSWMRNVFYFQKAGPIYGLLPKFVRAQKVHQILWYLCYETYGKDMKPITKIEMEYGQSGETRDSLMTASEKVCQRDRLNGYLMIILGLFLIFLHNMSHVTRKPVFGVFDHVRHKPACAATEAC